MAQKITVTLIDDIDGTATAAETVAFALDGVTYEIDLSTENAAQLRESFELWVSHARRSGGRKKTDVRPAGGTSRDEGKAARAWARNNGYEVSDRGRIRTEVLEAYRKAH